MPLITPDELQSALDLRRELKSGSQFLLR